MTIKTIFSCQTCGYQSPKWLGRCPECEQWNTLQEEIESSIGAHFKKNGLGDIAGVCPPQKLDDIKISQASRASTGIAELDRILGGGLVRGSVLLVGGEPGIGKSTLMLQVSGIASRKEKVLYVSGEESAGQIKLRADRLDLSFGEFYVVNETNTSRILSYIKEFKPCMVVVDSIQTLCNPDFSQSAGTITQIKESASILTAAAKASGFSVFFIGHITKEGIIAGPKILEHIVDCVIYFEGQKESDLRLLRAVKNRFGATDEVGIFSMNSEGLVEVKDASGIFISNNKNPVTGSCIMPVIEGTRAMLVEIQALVSSSNYGMPRQRSAGFDPNRCSLLAAGLVKNMGINLANQDVFLNVVGGVKVEEPASDLAACVAICSSFKERPVRRDTVVTGEVGLCSEVRGVSRIALRINEARRMGYKRIVLPEADRPHIKGIKGIELAGVNSVEEALREVFL